MTPQIAQRALEPASVRRRPSLRVAVFSYGLPRVGEKRGGGDRVAHDLADGLGRLGHQVTVWSYDPRPEGAAYEVRPLPWDRFCSSWFGRRVTLGYLGNLVAVVPDYSGFDAIITMGDSLLLPFKGKPVVRVMLGSALGEALSATSPWRFVMQVGVYAQELLTALTQRHTVGISRNTRRYNPFVRKVIPIGVDLTDFTPDPAAKTAHPSILFVGALSGRKRGALLLDWFRDEIRPRFPAARLEMVSPPGPAVEGVTYHTGISTEELAALYRSAWVYASPSSYEGFGLPYLEAMASGTPVVASPNPGSLEVMAGGDLGRVVSDDEFAGALAELLASAELRAKLAEAGLAGSARYSLDKTVRAYEDLLYSIVGRAQ